MDVHKIARLLTVVIIGILSLIKEGLGIECYMCNSNRMMPDCDKISTLSAEQRKPYVTKCWQLPDGRSRNYTMCRTIKQEVNGDTSTIRQCATAGAQNSCTRKTGTHKIKMEYCECDTDLCNMASPAHRIPTELLCAMFTLCLALSRRI